VLFRSTPEAARAAAAGHARQLLTYAWAADRILRAHDQPGVVRAELYFTSTGTLVSFPIDRADLGRVEAVLEAVGRAGHTPLAGALDGGALEPPPPLDLPLRVHGVGRGDPLIDGPSGDA
jgi:hypothetical protein